jgi:diguanylate cyclase (GGDEF)-like protein
VEDAAPQARSGGTEPAERDRSELGAKAIAVVVLVDLVAFGLACAGILTVVPSTGELLLALALVALAVVHTELATGIERARRQAAEHSYFDLSSVWTFAAALLLPPGTAALVIIVVYLHLWARVWRPAGMPLHRHLYTTATVVLAARVAHEIVERTGGLPRGLDDGGAVTGILLAVGAYVVVNTALVALAIAVAGPRVPLLRLLGRWDDNALEVATLCMGALAAVALASAPGLVALVLPPILVLHRAVLVRQLETDATTDAKTGLLNAAAWRVEAERAVVRVRRTGRSAAVLILDLDHFKVVNDTYGHLVGDEVLAAVADALRAGLREGDVVGRFGGEEFVVLLPDLPSGGAGRAELAVVAERLRRRVEELDLLVPTPTGACTVDALSVSVGGAVVPCDGTSLSDVLAAADRSLYEAKGSGRNVVRLAAVTVPAPRRPVA